MKVSVVTPVHNCPELAYDYARVVAGCDEIIIVDNASDARAADVWASVASLYIRNETNAHYMGGCNQGYAHATGDIIIFANNDIRGPEASLLAWAERISVGVLYGAALAVFQAPRQPISYIDGWLIGAMRETWRALLVDRGNIVPGPFDTSIFTGEYANDLDLSWRATQKGIPLRKLPTTIEHLSNYTSRRTPGAYDHAEANRQAFVRRVLGDA
jgi:GT2 family glycosyltransferase